MVDTHHLSRFLVLPSIQVTTMCGCGETKEVCTLFNASYFLFSLQLTRKIHILLSQGSIITPHTLNILTEITIIVSQIVGWLDCERTHVKVQTLLLCLCSALHWSQTKNKYAAPACLMCCFMFSLFVAFAPPLPSSLPPPPASRQPYQTAYNGELLICILSHSFASPLFQNYGLV